MTHLEATVPQAPQAPHAMRGNNLGAGYLQQRPSKLQKPVYRGLEKNFLENPGRVFHYSVIGGAAAGRLAAANPDRLSLIDDTMSTDARVTLSYATGASAGSPTSHPGSPDASPFERLALRTNDAATSKKVPHASKVQRHDDAVDRLMQQPAAHGQNRQRRENIRATPPCPLFAKPAPVSYGYVLVPTDPGITSNKWSGR